MKACRLFRRLWGRLALGAGAIAVVIAFASFDDYDTPSTDVVRAAAVAVVFTGQFERVDAALRLLDQGLVRRVFISGVNAGAGLKPKTFVEQFARRNPAIENLGALVQCCVVWGTSANTTIQNADEAKCWLDQQHIDGPVLLVSGREHLARATLALRQALGPRRITAFPVSETDDELGLSKKRATEFIKLLGLSVAVWTPWYRSSRQLHAIFAHGCPTSLPDHSATDSRRVDWIRRTPE